MTKNDLLQNIDLDIYSSTCLEAKRLANYTGKSNEIGITFNSMIPHDISEELWELDIPVDEKLEIFFNLFEEMPCYAYLMYLAMEFKNKFNINERVEVCLIFRRYLMEDYEIFKTPICYSLWSDYLDDKKWSDFVWDNILLNDYENNKLIISLFSVSGPVSWNKKIDLINKVIEKREMHIAIYDCIIYSAFDYYGQIDKKEALMIIDKLDVETDSANHELLLNELLKQ